jgi:Flp pilus assembly protein TadD
MRRVLSVFACGLLAAALPGCESARDASWTAHTEYTGSTSTIQNPRDPKYYASDESVRLGWEYFSRGDFGTAERHFRDSVEKAPEDLSAWIGLAASYDRIGRYDLADKAYGTVLRLGGETVQTLNNIGYSYMLRGDLVSARAKFSLALERDPQNPTILNNLQLLDGSHRFIQRDGAAN